MLSSPARERKRVASHIHRAERKARARDVRSLTRIQKLVRALLLDELATYRKAGRFPKNPGLPWMVPQFVDGEGTRCAMAHLLETGGALEAVRAIAGSQNFAFVRELARSEAFTEWLTAAGFTVEEAAAIQPSYCDVPAVCVCGGGFAGLEIAPAPGVLEATVSSVDMAQGGYMQGTATITATYGNAFGYKAGDVVPIEAYGSAQTVGMTSVQVGQIALVPLRSRPDAGADGGGGRLEAMTLDMGGMPTRCASRNDLPGGHPNKDQTIAALRSTSCVAELAKVDGKWDDKCSGNGSLFGCGCDTPGGTTANDNPLAIAILLAVVGTMTFRRFAKR